MADGTGAARSLFRESDDRRKAVDRLIDGVTAWLLDRQEGDGHWVFELEADTTIPSEYIFLNHYLGEIDDAKERKLAAYIRARQGTHGGWPLFHGGNFDMSASVKAYFALKLVGDDPEAPHMARARAAILGRGGAARSNVFTRYTLALFEQVPWRAVPVMRAEAVLLPKWAPFHLDKVSYWSRTVMVPLLVLATLKPKACNPRGIGVSELFTVPPDEERQYLRNPTGGWKGEAFLLFDRFLRVAEPAMPGFLARRAVSRAMAFVRERLNGEDGLGAIFPAMVNAMLALLATGVPRDDPDVVTAREAVDRLLVMGVDSGYCQPCVSPVWDTGLAMLGLLEAGATGDDPAMVQARRWLRGRQITELTGDWGANRGHVRPGGWAFQYRNDHYPDVDDTAVVVMALHRASDGSAEDREAIARGAEWIIGMQSENGGWGSFDADNEHYLLNHIPFADHGALLDPPTADVSARCLGMLAQLGYGRDHPAVARAIDYLKREQEADGSWFGRWGTNYVYGTWSVLSALNAIGEDPEQDYIRRAVDWLKGFQLSDGGWGEDCATYWQERRGEVKASTPSQTAWALLGLMAAGEAKSPEVARGIDYLLSAERDGGRWREELFNAVGFPRVFYLRYHGYSTYFPLFALARYRTLMSGNAATSPHGL